MKTPVVVPIRRLGVRVVLALVLVTLSATILKPTSASTTSTPPFSGWLVLDGVDDYALAEDHPELDVGDEPGESVTIEAWVNLQKTGVSPLDRFYVVNKAQSYEVYLVRYGFMPRTGCIGLLFESPSGQLGGFEHCRTPAFGLGWHHVAVVFYKETGEAQIYLDGNAFGTPHNVGTAIKNSAADLRVGENLKAGLEEIRISDVARYTGATYTLPTSPFTCDEHTRALWHFDEFEGATFFRDACGTDNLLAGYNGAHTEGVPAYRLYVPFIAKDY